MNVTSVTMMMLPSRSVRNRCARLSAPPRRAQPLAGPVGGALAGGVLSDATAISARAEAYDFVTPAAVLVPSYRLLVLLYGPTVVLSRNFRPVFVSAIPVRLWDALYMYSCRIGRNPCRYGCWSIVNCSAPAASVCCVTGVRSYPPPLTPLDASPFCWITWPTYCVLPPSTANRPFVLGCEPT